MKPGSGFGRWLGAGCILFSTGVVGVNCNSSRPQSDAAAYQNGSGQHEARKSGDLPAREPESGNVVGSDRSPSPSTPVSTDDACSRCDSIITASRAEVDACGDDESCLTMAEEKLDHQMNVNPDCVTCLASMK